MPVGNYSSFILRLWVEPGGDWRWGVIQHVATRKKRRFSTVPDMLDFISRYAITGEVSIPFSLDGIELSSEAVAALEASDTVDIDVPDEAPDVENEKS